MGCDLFSILSSSQLFDRPVWPQPTASTDSTQRADHRTDATDPCNWPRNG